MTVLTSTGFTTSAYLCWVDACSVALLDLDACDIVPAIDLPRSAPGPRPRLEPRATLRIDARMPHTYTRRGDEGMTDTYSGERLSKDAPLFAIIGTIDELSSHIGVARCHITDPAVGQQLRAIQTWLYQIMGDLATLKAHDPFFITTDTEPAAQLEAWIDNMDKSLERLTAFILPGGKSLAGAHLQVCRTICRSAERQLVAQDVQDRAALRFINRLSSYFFTAARYVELERRAAKYERVGYALGAIVLLAAAICARYLVA